MQQVLQATGLASGVQVQNIPGGGGTVGLASASHGQRSVARPWLTIGPPLAGAIFLNKSPVSLDDTEPMGVALPRVRGACGPGQPDIKTVGDLVAKLKARPGLSRGAWLKPVRHRPHQRRADGESGRRGLQPSLARHLTPAASSFAATLGGHVTVSIGGGRLPRNSAAVGAGGLRMIAVSAPERVRCLGNEPKEQDNDIALPSPLGALGSPETRIGDPDRNAESITKMLKRSKCQSENEAGPEQDA